MAQVDDTENFVQVRIRMQRDLQQRLDRSANERGASMNAEIVERLERSIASDTIIGGPIIEDRPVIALARMMASAMHDAGRTAAFMATRSAAETANWYGNAFAYDQAVQAAATVLEAFRPPGNTAAPRLKTNTGEDLSQTFSTLGSGFANSLIEEVARGAARTAEDVSKVSIIANGLMHLRDRITDRAIGPTTTPKEVWGSKYKGKRAGGKK
ncbi:MAG: Arc family DNA-binding protein [Alphaproteobacteria bacterium]|nr:Arc family DNA-binding protein [Alphaproteobacteria bacterium]